MVYSIRNDAKRWLNIFCYAKARSGECRIEFPDCGSVWLWSRNRPIYLGVERMIIDNGVIKDGTGDGLYTFAEITPSPQEQMLTMTRALASSVTTLTDTTALAIPDLLPAWAELLAAGNQVAAGVCLVHNGQTYRVVQAVTPIESQPPGGEGMLAIYRPIEREHTGTMADPIPWVSGMDCVEGKYYSYNGKTYRVAEGGTMSPCVWPPDTPGLWQWEVVS